MYKIITCEQVSCGHPDKICDQIADAIVTWCLKQNEDARCAIEVMAKNECVMIAGEISGVKNIPYSKLINQVCDRIGIPQFEYVQYSDVSEQSADIALGVDRGGAGDQGVMIGYATNETSEMLPKPFVIATRALEILRQDNKGIFLPDAKAQVSYNYSLNNIDTFLISSQHREEASKADIQKYLLEVINQTAEEFNCGNMFTTLVNPTGRFVIGGTYADTGVTGRKIVCDAYGNVIPVGGGAFSGKDPTKVDRSAAYMARYVARDLVNIGYCDTCKIQVAYAIGLAQPVSICVWADGKYSPDLVIRAMNQYDWTPKGIIDKFDLKYFNYNKVSSGGHFGRPFVPWG